MKFILTILAIVLSTFWLAKITGPIKAKQEIAQAHTLQATSQAHEAHVREPTLEEHTEGIVRAVRNKGIPRQISPEFILVRAERIGTQVVTTYEFAVPIDPANAKNHADMRQEIRQNFRVSVACTDKFTRSLFQRGVTFIQRYNYYRSTKNIITIKLVAKDCL